MSGHIQRAKKTCIVPRSPVSKTPQRMYAGVISHLGINKVFLIESKILDFNAQLELELCQQSPITEYDVQAESQPLHKQCNVACNRKSWYFKNL